jgi:hypothetical protein
MSAQTFTLWVGGRALQVTVVDVTCAYPGCTEPRRTDRASYCATHNTPAARVATLRARQRAGP